MNKQTNSVKELKEQVTLHIGAPTTCPFCGLTDKQMQEEFEVAWLEHRIPNTTFVFYVCPGCGICVGNRHARENAKKIREHPAPPRILQPQKSIILPGKN